jgi:hypothetical protein
MDQDQQRYLQMLNDVEVSPEQLVGSLLRNAAPSADNFGDLTMTKVSFAVTETSKPPNPELACHMRLLALFALIGRKENIGWEWVPVFPFLSEDPVLKAASTVPLVSNEGGITFQPDVFAATLERIQPTPN